MANTAYPNFVLANKIQNLLLTAVNTRSLMTVDTQLAENAGMRKTVNTYTYTGEAEAVAAREGNTATGSVAYVGTNYDVGVLQQKADYTDEDIMKDPLILEVLMKGASQVMTNKLTADFYAALATKAEGVDLVGKTEFPKGGSIGYVAIVDAIADMNVEDESQLFLLISPEWKGAIRKDEDYKSAQMGEVIYNGMIGTIAGIPVIVSKALSDKNCAYLMTKDAVTLFIKEEVEVEQDRDPDTRVNDVYFRTAYVVALTDATKARKIVEAIA